MYVLCLICEEIKNYIMNIYMCENKNINKFGMVHLNTLIPICISIKTKMIHSLVWYCLF